MNGTNHHGQKFVYRRPISLWPPDLLLQRGLTACLSVPKESLLVYYPKFPLLLYQNLLDYATTGMGHLLQFGAD